MVVLLACETFGADAEPTLLAFLSSGCSVCERSWGDLRSGRRPAELPPGIRFIATTKDPSEESRSRLREQADGGMHPFGKAAWYGSDPGKLPSGMWVVSLAVTPGPPGTGCSSQTAGSTLSTRLGRARSHEAADRRPPAALGPFARLGARPCWRSATDAFPRRGPWHGRVPCA